MNIIDDEQVEKVAALLGASDITSEEIESSVAAQVNDLVTTRRLIDWIPEAFGIVLVSHMGKLTLPTTFRAKNSHDQWIELPFSSEPIFASSLRLAQEMYHNGPREAFKNIASRSAMVAVINNALNAGGSIDGASLSGPAMLGIPAEFYLPKKMSFWSRWKL